MHLMRTNISCFILSAQQKQKTCVCFSEPGDLRQALRNRLPIMPAVPIDCLSNQQLSPSDQSGRRGGREPPPHLAPLLSAQERLHSAGVRLARGWAHWWRLTPA